MDNQIKKEYLGDSVYASFNGWHIILTTENGYPDDPHNQIMLEDSVMNALRNYADRAFQRGERDESSR